MQVRIAKYELYPKDAPIGYAIGFNVIAGGRDFYRDTIVSLEDILPTDIEKDIVAKAWEALEENIMTEVQILESRPQALGGVWSPADGIITPGGNTVVDPIDPDTGVSRIDELEIKVDELNTVIDTMLTGGTV